MSDFIPQMQPWFDAAEANAVHTYLQSGGWITEFKETERFAKMVADFTGAKYCSIVSNGTVSLSVALLSQGIGAGDEVIVPAYTMVASANAVLMACGAKPIFVDVERDTLCMDSEALEAAVTARTRAVMLVSINGRYPRGLNRIVDLCQRRSLFLLEDAAQSLGSLHHGKHLGRYGQVGSFSFSMPKIITTGQGGALITDDPTLHRKISLVRNFGREEAGVDRHVFFGGNFKFTDLQAVVGIEQMRKLSSRVELKKKIFASLRERLKDVPEIAFLETSGEVAPWFNDPLVDDRERLQSHLKRKGIGSRPFYPVVPTQAPYGQPYGQFKNADFVADRGLWLPSFAQLTEAEIERIAEGVRSFYR